MDRERIGTKKPVFYWSQWFDRSLVLLGPHCGRKKKKKLPKKEAKGEEISLMRQRFLMVPLQFPEVGGQILINSSLFFKKSQLEMGFFLSAIQSCLSSCLEYIEVIRIRFKNTRVTSCLLFLREVKQILICSSVFWLSLWTLGEVCLSFPWIFASFSLPLLKRWSEVGMGVWAI